MSKNFSVGDVVVCLRNDGAPELNPRQLYTVVGAFIDCDGDPGIEVAEAAPTGVDEDGARWRGFVSDLFTYAYRPDPEVEREALKDPLTVQDKPKRRANAAKASEPHQ